MSVFLLTRIETLNDQVVKHTPEQFETYAQALDYIVENNIKSYDLQIKPLNLRQMVREKSHFLNFDELSKMN